MEKVYCSRCRHFNTWVTHNKCSHPKNVYYDKTESTSLNPPKRFKNYKWQYFDKNFDNNCKYYEPTPICRALIRRVLKFLTEI